MAKERTFRSDFSDLIHYAWMRTLRPQHLDYHGLRVPVQASSQLRSLARKILRGLHERSEIGAVTALLKPDDVVLELGAGTGILSAVMAKQVAQGSVHSYEANPALQPSAQAVFAANGVSVHYRVAAVGVTSGRARFFVGRRSLSGGGASLIDRGDAEEIDVAMEAFAEVLEQVKPSFLMMDVEGAERDLLKMVLPSRIRALCVEIHPHVIGDADASGIVKHLLEQGFLLRIDHSQDRVLAFTRGSGD